MTKRERAQARCNRLWPATIRAERAYAIAIQRVAGPRASRYMLTEAQKKHPAIVKAKARKLAVELAHENACTAGRR